MDERQKDLSNYRITQADDSLKVADYCLKETNESIYITQNDEGDMVIKSIDTYEKREQLLRLRARVLQAEWERIDGAKTMSATEARKKFERETRRAVELTVWIDTCEVTGNVPRGVFCGQSKQ